MGRAAPLATVQHSQRCRRSLTDGALLLLTAAILMPLTGFLGGHSGSSTVPTVSPIPAPRQSSSVSGGALPGDGGARPQWTQLHPLIHPSDRFDAHMAYDAADGYVVLFGGWVYPSLLFNASPTRCLNDTWIYRGGVWTNLSIPGPPQTCSAAMAYDAADGYVVAYITWNQTSPYYIHRVNETWKFSHGAWTQLDIPEPGIIQYPTATYDPVERAVVLYGIHCHTDYPGSENCTYAFSDHPMQEQTWDFSNGAWKLVSQQLNPFLYRWCDYCLNYDSSDGYVMLPASTGQFNDGFFGEANATWMFINGRWGELGMLPSALLFDTKRWGECDGGAQFSCMTLVDDPKDGYVLLYGTPWLRNGSIYNSVGDHLGNVTWTYSDGEWTNESLAGPPGRFLPSIVFDAADGYVMLFGGLNTTYTSSRVVGNYLSDTWIYTAPPVETRLSVSVSPLKICSVVSEDCGAGTDHARVTVTADVVPVPKNTSGGGNDGNGTVVYGPSYWIAQPNLTFVGWKNLTPDPFLDPLVDCSRADGGPTHCSTVPTVSTWNGTSTLTWTWSSPDLGWQDALVQGDSWTVSFNVLALGPPYATVPVDACVTAACLLAHSNASTGVYAGFGFSPWDNASRLLESLPLGTVTVLPPLTYSNPPPSTVPPPPVPPPSVGVPLPIGTPAPPVVTPNPSPVLTPVSTGAVPSSAISFTAVAAGLLGAGIARVVMPRLSVGMRVGVRVSARPGPRPPIRGEG